MAIHSHNMLVQSDLLLWASDCSPGRVAGGQHGRRTAPRGRAGTRATRRLPDGLAAHRGAERGPLLHLV